MDGGRLRLNTQGGEAPSSPRAALLADPNFPKSALSLGTEAQQILLQDLYERYSALAFTRSTDRPLAIVGLQRRLGRVLETRAAHGLFGSHFARGLLWKPKYVADGTGQAGGRVARPTWSWLPTLGEIKYLDIDFQRVEWATTEFTNPLSDQQPAGAAAGGALADEWTSADVVRGLSRRLTISRLRMLNTLRFDEAKVFDLEELRCVVIGRDSVADQLERDPKQHVLLISRLDEPVDGGNSVYRRVGVASLRENEVGRAASWVVIV